MIEILRESWGWIGLEPAEIVGENDFGNLMIRDTEDRYWRLCPEELSCKIVARNRADLDAMSQDQQFLHDWYMQPLVEKAKELLGPLTPEIKYCLKIPGILGGEYGGVNLATISLLELIRYSGDVAKQIRDVPDGTEIQFRIVDQ